MKFFLIYLLIIMLRFLVHLKTQSGYIHPDEFFQTIEVVAGNTLNWQVNIPWEFNIDFPIRSQAIIELFINIPLKFYLTIRKNIEKFILLPSVDILLFCRLLTALCSLIVDYSIYTVSRHLQINYKCALYLHGISHISMVLLIRNWSNTWETQIMSAFLILFYRSNVHGHTRSNMFTQGALIALGIFCRPTFIVFVAPYLCLTAFSCRSLFQIFEYASNGFCGFLSVSMVIISFDTYRYRKTDNAPFSVVITAWNFFKYNSNSSNLIQHGYHPFYTHILANVPQLFGPLSGFLFLGPVLAFKEKHVAHLFRCIAFPIFCLSLFPHQEFRFLLPITPLATVLVTSLIYHIKSHIKIIKFILACHVLFSLTSIIFWGYLHEGGVLAAAKLVQSNIQTSSNKMCHKIVAYKTFLMPMFLLELRDSNWCNNSVTNLMGIPESRFWQEMTLIKQKNVSRTTGHSVLLHLIYPKAFIFKDLKHFMRLGTLKSSYDIPGHINTDLWPPQVSLSNFMSLQYKVFAI